MKLPYYQLKIVLSTPAPKREMWRVFDAWHTDRSVCSEMDDVFFESHEVHINSMNIIGFELCGIRISLSTKTLFTSWKAFRQYLNTYIQWAWRLPKTFLQYIDDMNRISFCRSNGECFTTRIIKWWICRP